MIRITPNFSFSGRCEEAIRLYEEAFGARIACLMRYSDANAQDMNDAWVNTDPDWVFHSEVFIGDQRIMMADHIDLDTRPSPALSLLVTLDTKEDVMRAYEVLREGGSVLYAPHSTTYSSCSTNVIDRFGYRWGIMTEQTER